MTSIFTFPLTVLALFTAAILAFSSPALATSPGKGVPSDGQASASVGVYSNLVWRGQELTRDGSIQPMADLSRNGFGFNLWSNYDVEKGSIVETDVTLNFKGTKDKLGYDVGIIYYGTSSPTTELYVSVDYDTILSPYANLYWDVDAGQGAFLMLGVGHSLAVTGDIAIDFGTYVGVNFNNGTMGVDENGEKFTDFYNMDLNAKTSIPFAGAWFFNIELGYSFALTDAAKSGISGASATGEHNVFYGGIGVTLPF